MAVTKSLSIAQRDRKKSTNNKAPLSFGRTSAGIVWCFWGKHNIETTTVEYLIAELARKLMNQKNMWNQKPNRKQFHFHMRKHQLRKS